MAELCRRYKVSRKTGHKWWRRYCEGGVEALKDRRSRPLSSPRQTPVNVENELVKLRRSYPTWGPRKQKPRLEKLRPDLEVPAPSTIGEVLKRNGLIVRRRRPRQSVPATSPFAGYERANAVWCADFKGHFAVGSKRCHPLTIVDGYSRYLVACQALSRTNGERVRKVFFEAFRTFGLPDVIRTDNGPPFASTGAGGLSDLAVWLMKLGIRLERIEPGHPEQNGRQERFHRTLKQDTASPPCGSLAAQQRRFNIYRQHYNEVRPHEALGQEPPSEFYQPSTRPLPDRWLDPAYPDSYELFRTTAGGAITWRGFHIQLNRCLDKECVGVVHRDGQDYDAYFGEAWLGQFAKPRTNTKNIRLITSPSARPKVIQS